MNYKILTDYQVNASRSNKVTFYAILIILKERKGESLLFNYIRIYSDKCLSEKQDQFEIQNKKPEE